MANAGPTFRPWMVLSLALLTAAAPSPLTGDAVRHRLATGDRDFSGQNLAGADLTGLDFSGANLSRANLAGANLYRVKLVGADLTGANLRGANLRGVWIMRARFDHANLHAAQMPTIVTSYGMENQPDLAASFVAADLSDTSGTIHYSFDDMRGANLRGARYGVNMANQSMGLLRSEFDSAHLENADFTGADLGRNTFRYAHLEHATFRNANLTHADFTGAYLTGTDFTGAKLDGAIFDEPLKGK